MGWTFGCMGQYLAGNFLDMDMMNLLGHGVDRLDVFGKKFECTWMDSIIFQVGWAVWAFENLNG